MALRQVEETINDRKYTLTRFGAVKSLGLTSKLTKSLGLTEGEDIDVANIIVSLVGSEDFVDLVQTLCKEVTCNGLAIDFDDHFAEHPQDLAPVLGLSLKENIAPFIDPNALSTLFDLVLADLQQ